MAVVVQGYAFFSCFSTGLVLSVLLSISPLTKHGNQKVISLNLISRGVLVGSEVLSQAVTSIRLFMAPSINWLNFTEKKTSLWFSSLLTSSERGFHGSSGQRLSTVNLFAIRLLL